MKKQMILTVLAALCFSLPAFAAEPAAKAAAAPGTAPITKEVAVALDTFTQGCQQELSTYCKDVTPGEGRILDCMVANRPKLSSACAQQVDKYAASRAAAPQSRAEGK